MADVRIPLRLLETSSAEDVSQILRFLEDRGTFHFPTLPNGLFSAVSGETEDIDVTGYRNVWVRDNIHIAHAHWRWGDQKKAVAALKALMTFFEKYQPRLKDILNGRLSASDPMNRPHIRFNGSTLSENSEKWSHAQNDALGAFLWLAGKMSDQCNWNEAQLSVIDDVARFLVELPYWTDEDSGHWEEVRKISASSIGIVVAALETWKSRLGSQGIEEGRRALDAILPAECIQPDPSKARQYDSALLFLIYPYQSVSDSMADAIVGHVKAHLSGEYGIRRYLGDSYWCADYKEKLSANVRTGDFSDNMADRDRLLEPGREAQWCLFDPIISIHYGIRFQSTGDQEFRAMQIHHLNRSLKQLTTADHPRGAYRCPESYYMARGQYVPNDICPLLWTQANLKLALTHLMNSLT